MKNKSLTFLRGIWPRRKDVYDTHSSPWQVAGYSGKVRDKKYKLAILDTHPIQYRAPIFKKLAQEEDIDLTVYLCAKGGKEKWDLPLLEGYRFEFLKNYSPWPNPNRFFGLINPEILPILKREKYDAIIIHGYMHMTNWLVFLSKGRTETSVIMRGEADNTEPRKGIKKIIKHLILSRLFKKIDAVLYSYCRNKEFYESYGVVEKKLFPMPCAVDNEFFKEHYRALKPKKHELKKEVGIINSDLATILFVGQFIKRKRITDLLHAYADIQDATPVNIVLVGQGEEEGALREIIREKGLKNIYIVGFKNQSELPVYYTIADILVLPSERDPSPKVINEAMNFELPIITTNEVGTASDLVEKSGSGLLYDAGDITQLAEHLKELIGNKTRREEMGRAAEKTIAKWSIEEDVRGIKKALHYICGQKNGEGRDESRKFYEDIHGKGYSEGPGPTEPFYRELQAFIRRFNLEEKKVLEIGSGMGTLQDVVKDYVGIDVAESLRKKYHKPYHAIQDETYPFHNETFDAIFTRATFEHIPNIDKALEETLRVLKRGGVLFFSPAWHVRSWARDGYAVRSYRTLDWKGKAIKFSILWRDNIFFRASYVMPKRAVRTLRYMINKKRFLRLEYKKIKPNYEKVWTADSDACNHIDPHAAILYFYAHGCEVMNYENCWKAFFVRTGSLMVKKYNNIWN